jgi:hypothetical protein
MSSRLIDQVKQIAVEYNTGILTESKRKHQKKPYHKYKNKSGHHIHVYIKKTKTGHAAHFHNKTFGSLEKTVHWSSTKAKPTKKELELLESEHASIINLLIEKTIERKKLDPDTAGKISEVSAVIHMIHHKHDAEGTINSEAHKTEIAPYRKYLKKLSEGKDLHSVKVRIAHGREMSNAALAHIKEKHGENAYPKRVGHTSKSGDIGRFTNGKHNDGQENPSDMMIEIGHKSKRKK